MSSRVPAWVTGRASMLKAHLLIRGAMVATALLMMLYAFTDIRLRYAEAILGPAQPSSTPECPVISPAPIATLKQRPKEEDEFPVLNYVNGPPALSVHENVRKDTKYVTSLADAGWTNDFMSFCNLIYIGILSGRTAILPPFSPTHFEEKHGIIPVSHAFDLQRLRRAIQHPVIEWADMKEDDALDSLGCWSTWMANDEKGNPRGSHLEYWLHIDVAYTAAPNWTFVSAGGDVHPKVGSLARLGTPEGRAKAFEETLATRNTPLHHKALPPDDRILCFDSVYYAVSEMPWEWNYDWYPAWKLVARHMRFNQTVVALAEEYLGSLFGIENDDTGDDERIPPFIVIHARHGDFKNLCGGKPKDECFPTIASLAKDVDQVRGKLQETKGIDVQKVIVTSDETDPEWWRQIREMGWYYIDHEKFRTTQRLGFWYTVLIEGCIQSMATGFVGTEASTMSLIAARRVEEWNGGVSVMTPWRS